MVACGTSENRVKSACDLVPGLEPLFEKNESIVSSLIDFHCDVLAGISARPQNLSLYSLRVSSTAADNSDNVGILPAAFNRAIWRKYACSRFFISHLVFWKLFALSGHMEPWVWFDHRGDAVSESTPRLDLSGV
jgi:hypothetical protein